MVTFTLIGSRADGTEVFFEDEHNEAIPRKDEYFHDKYNLYWRITRVMYESVTKQVIVYAVETIPAVKISHK